jgi:hypothetical protein
MTIIVTGHVEKMEASGLKILLTLRLESERSKEPLVVEATASELSGQYLPGTPVQIQITPAPKE